MGAADKAKEKRKKKKRIEVFRAAASGSSKTTRSQKKKDKIANSGCLGLCDVDRPFAAELVVGKLAKCRPDAGPFGRVSSDRGDIPVDELV